MPSKMLTLDHITKIEGHASLLLQVEGKEVKRCELASVEGSRYFEGILRNHQFNEASEISSRICGICSCAHTVAAIMAVEDALKIVPTEQTVLLRELLTIGERIRSHATHLYFLALPDYLGYESALAMLPRYKPEVERALRMMRVGNEIVKAIGGRDLHPVSCTVGGFLKFPTSAQLRELSRQVEGVMPDMLATAKLVGNLKMPKFERKTEYFSLYNGKSYPVLQGAMHSQSCHFEQRDYLNYLSEYHEPRSSANFVVKEGKSYMVGALSRVNNNYRFLDPLAKRMAKAARVSFPNHNPFYNNLSQALELVHFGSQVQKLCERLDGVEAQKPILAKFKAPTRGVAAIEVPRGTLWHEYGIDKGGRITNANIVTPTAQNLRNMQDDIRAYLPQVLDLPRQRVVLEVEKLIRSYDPCFSCSTHFLKVRWVKGTGR